jgi:hypothetical protein
VKTTRRRYLNIARSHTFIAGTGLAGTHSLPLAVDSLESPGKRGSFWREI